MDLADVYGAGRVVRHRNGGGHGVQDDGQARAAGRDEALPAAGRVARAVLVVSSGRYRYGGQRQQLVRSGLPLLHTELYRLVHARPLRGRSRTDKRPVRGGAGAYPCPRHDVHEPASTSRRRSYGHLGPRPDRGDDGTDGRGRSDQHGKGRGQTVVHLADGGRRGRY